MTFDPETATFLIAGPVKIHPRVLRAMATSSLNHRGDYFHGVVKEIRDLLPVMFGTTGTQVVLSGSGTAGLEAMYSSLLPAEGRVVVLSNGNFGERSDKIVRKYAKNVTTIAAPWGQPIAPSAVRAELEKGDVSAVCLVHNETSVGLTNDLGGIAAEVKRAGSPLLLVDGISAVAGIPIQIREWGIDAIVGGSQKGLAAPAGLALVHLSDRAVAALHPGSFYLDLKAHVTPLEKNDTPWTPAVPLFLALREALLLLKEEGLDHRLAHSRRLAEACRAAGEALGLELFPVKSHASDTVTAFRNPDGLGDPEVRKTLEKEYNILVQGGQGAATGKIFRIGHMGIADWPDVLVTFAALERILARHGRLPAPGAGVRAVVDHMP